jgi:hypothetical protein
MPESRRKIDEKRMADLPNGKLFADPNSAIYSPKPRDQKGLRPHPGDRTMTRFLFLKFGRIGHKNGSIRRVSNSGIDVKLLSLLSARYV